MNSLESFFKVLRDDGATLESTLKDLDRAFQSEGSNSSMAFDKRAVMRQIRFLDELEQLEPEDNNMKVLLDDRLERVSFVYEDRHTIDLCVSYDLIAPGYILKNHSLPPDACLHSKYSSLKLAMESFYDCIQSLQEYLDIMDQLDQNCTVIDPRNPTCKDNYRRILVDKDITASLVVSVDCPNKPPDIKLLGPTRHTDVLMKKIRDRINQWDPDLSFIYNLTKLLDLPEAHITLDEIKSVEVYSVVECCICFAEKDQHGTPATVKCEHISCQQNYHATCLYQWLIAISNNVQRFDIIHGECPSCRHTITCPVSREV